MNERFITPNAQTISKEERNDLFGHKSPVVWLTGLSASGKSTIANELDSYLHQNNYRSYVLDGDNIRMGLNKDLGFSDTDRKENIRRIAEVAKLFSDAGVITITAFISPFEEDRQNARAIIGAESFIEVFIDTPLAICEERDPKGLYKKARKGEIKMFTGIDSVYEAPSNPSLIVKAGYLTIEESKNAIAEFLHKNYL